MTSSLVEAAWQIRHRRLDPVDLVEQCLERIRRYDDRLRAWVVVDVARARELARQRSCEAQRGLRRGPLHGVPLGIKDLIDVAGLPTRAGSPLTDPRPVAADAPLVAALRRAGAIILGKTVTVEFAAFDPPPTRNPWDPDLQRTPGGSSSGSAAALAMGMCPGAIGTQTGGSLVRPASYCGVATCKPTFGRISTEGIVPLSPHLDHPGPMGRSVADLALLLECLIRGFRPAGNLPRPPRLGLVENFFMERADATIREATASAVARLRAAGAEIQPVRLDADFQAILDMHWRIMAVDAAAFHRKAFAAHRQSYGPMLARLLDEGLTIAGADYAAALAHQRELKRTADDWIGRLDALIMPSTDTTAPGLETTGKRDFQAPWSYTGLPVVSIPCGLGADHMPAAVQLVQRHGHEPHLLAVARWCERHLGFTAAPPGPR